MIHQDHIFCNDEITADEASQMNEGEWLEWLNSGLDEDYQEIPFDLPLPSYYFDAISPQDEYGLEARG